MKKIIAPILALAFILTPLTSCTNGTAETSGSIAPSGTVQTSETSSGKDEDSGSFDVDHPRFTSDMSA